MATVAQIAVSAAENLGILGEGETLPSYETDDLDKAYTEVHSELQSLGLTSWSPTADIPDRFSWSVGVLVAEHRALKYGVPTERYQELRIEANMALKKIRRLQTRSKMGQTEIENF